MKKIAVYKDRLAVQLSDKVVIYELLKDEDSYEMHYRVSTKIQKSMDCNLLVVTSRHVILCLEKKLRLFSFEAYSSAVGARGSHPVSRSWVDRRNAGASSSGSGRRHLKIFIDNPFPCSS